MGSSLIGLGIGSSGFSLVIAALTLRSGEGIVGSTYATFFIGIMFLIIGFVVLDNEQRRATCLDSLEGNHQWGEWSQPYSVHGSPQKWQERRCQCGNRDFRRAP